MDALVLRQLFEPGLRLRSIDHHNERLEIFLRLFFSKVVELHDQIGGLIAGLMEEADHRGRFAVFANVAGVLSLVLARYVDYAE